MESGRVVVQDVEEGEISDSASVEEITEEDFNKQDGSESKPEGGTESRVWTMRDLYHYPGFRTGWYNLAWAQGLQNKPINGVYVMDVDSKLSSSKEIERVVLDDSGDEAKEEGELEEGEIDLDSEPLPQCGSEARLSSIRDELGSVDLVNAEQSFEQVCSRIHGTLEGLQVGKEDGVVQMLFSALGVVNSVFSSMTPDQKEEKKEALSRLLSSVMNCDPPLLSPGQLNEIELMIASVSSVDSSPSSRVIDEEKDTQTTEHVHDMETDSTPSNADSNGSERTSVKWPSVASVIHSKPITSPEVLTPEVPAFKGRGLLLPLLDLHKDHDEDSLPSPTRDAPSCLPVQKPLGVGDGIVKPGSTLAKAVTGAEDSRLCQYETDAFKAVSSYQQKFGRSSFLMNDRLPSPTPSGEESADEDDDTNKEISSSFSGGNIRTTATPVLRPSVVSAPIPANSSISQIPIPAKVANPSTSGSNTTMKALAKSRDPRLRFANSDSGSLDLNQKPLITVQNAPKIETGEVINSRKQRASDEPNVDGPASKRQRNAIENVGIVSDMKSVSGVGGWLEDNGITGPPQSVNKNQLTETAEADPRISLLTVNGLSSTNGLDVGKEQVPITSTVNSLPELLKDIAGNPEILLNILKGQQQRLAAVAQPKSDPSKDATHPPSANLIPGSAPLVSIPPLKASGALQAPAGSASVTSQVGPVRTQDDTAKIRMKPRDPRRVLHGHTLQKTGSLVNEPLKTTAAPIMGKDNLNDQKMQEGQADKKLTPSQSIVAPDIARQFTKNLRNIADIMSVSADPSPPIVSLNLSSQPAQVKPDRGAVKAVASNNEDQQGGTASTPESTVSGPSRGPNTWGDVEHLFKAYDDTQKLAIQRERERRLEEQKKMFESRKLSLVLDLDHTLLNSAKFVEVDLVHDEILRKKEEQDREKPQRHLYRLPHMGMWTKLRPGIWNFLDKASKLFELHLYTMGNKLYATEMAKVLDPKGTLFSGRVISKGDDEDPFDGDERVPKSKDLEGVMGMESSVVIVDDSVRVWPHNKLNLIVVERYTYFPCSRRQFGLPGPSLLEIDHDERPEEGTLASSLGVIERIHQNFFSHQSLDEADVRNILASEQQKILAGCRIVFSRVFPVSEVNPHLHPLWQTAQQFGAVCTPQIDDQVTHVVANSPGTDKVNWALANGRFAVHPGWVEASALLYRRANEQDFAIKPTQP